MPAPTHPVIHLVDEVSRLRGRLKELFAPVHAALDLSEIEMSVLNAVIEAETPPTVPRIGRSLGHPRQVIQRAVNTLADRGLVESITNPDHKRAPLLTPTAQSVVLKREADAQAMSLLAPVIDGLSEQDLKQAVQLLNGLRGKIENQLREV